MYIQNPKLILPNHGIISLFDAVRFGLLSKQDIKTLLEFLDRISLRNPVYFNRSLSAFNLAPTIERLEKDRAAKFFDPANLERIGKRAGKFDFVSKLTNMIQNPGAFVGPTGKKQKLQMLQFISDQYNDHIGAPRTTVKLYDGPPNIGGYFPHGAGAIYINQKNAAFDNNFAKLVGTVVHENTHNLQDNPNIYSNPVLSRIYRANFMAYRNAEQHGYQAYRSQPVEIGAFAAGNMAESLMHKLAFANDNAFRPKSNTGRSNMHFNAA
jgi:hypothetical protein